jgi:hypothetical protein
MIHITNFPTGFKSMNSRDFSIYRCYPSLSYRWGITTGWIFIAIPLNAVWAIGMCALWMGAQHNSSLVRGGRNLGAWLAILDLSDALSQELGPHLREYSTHELNKILDRRHFVMYDVQQDEKGFRKVRLRPQPSPKSKTTGV